MAGRDGWTDTTLGLLVSLRTGKLDVNAGVEDGEFPFFTCSRDTYKIDVAAYSGKSVIVAGNGDLNVKYYEGEFNAYQRTYILQALDESVLNPSFLFHLMDKYLETLRNDTQGSTIQYLKKAQFTEAPIALPPLVEQKRIVDVVSSVDAYIDALQQQADMARTARNAVLHELLESVSTAPQKKLKDLTSKIGSGATPRGGEAVYQESGVSLIRSQNVHNGQFLHEGLVSISDSAAKALDGVSVEGNDVLINITGASVARACMVDASILPARVNQHVAILRTDSNQLLPGFLLQVLLGKKMNSYLLDISGSGTTRQAITKAQLEDLEVSIPPLVEQERIVEIVSSMDDVIRTTEQAVVDAKNLRSGLLSDLLSGEHEIPASYDVFVGAA